MARRTFALDGAKVREWRERRGWNQLRLATRAGITQSALSHIEAGRRAGSAGMQAKLAAALGVELDDITRRVEPEPAR